MRKLKALAAAAAMLFAGGYGVLASASPAYAGTGNQFCLGQSNSSCADAWNGGPWIKLAVSQNPGPNADFTEWGDGNGHVLLQFTGGGAWNGQCMGDAYNNANDARVSLGSCGSPIGHGSINGSLFYPVTSVCPFPRVAFQSVRWGGYLGPAQAGVSASQFYLDKPDPYCFNAFGPQ